MNKVAVIIPAYNEEITIKDVILDYNRELPKAEIYIINNNSNDNTSEYSIATLKKNKIKGRVIFEKRQGKGYAVQNAFYNINADYYIMVDADMTYPAKDVHKLLESVMNNECDMAIGDRLSEGRYKKENTRLFHNLGNNLVRFIINITFGSNLKDILTGLRVFNKKFVKNFPITSKGFEIETELTLHSLDKGYLIKEIPIDYKDRPEGSFSKLDTYKDGIRVIKTIIKVFKDYKPLLFFGIITGIFFIFGVFVGLPVIIEFYKTTYITKVPSAILATGFMIVSMLSAAIGIILDSILTYFKLDYQMKLNNYCSNNGYDKENL